MPSPFSRTLRSLEADGHRRWILGLVPTLLLLAAWSAWFLAARVTVYEVTEHAWLTVEREAHSIAAPVGGRIAALHISLGQRVKAGEVLAELEGDEPQALLAGEQARGSALTRQIAALRGQIAAERKALEEHRQAAAATLAEGRSRSVEAEAAAKLAEQEADRQARLLAGGLIPEAEAARTRSEAEQRRAAAESARLMLDRLAFSDRSAASDRQADIEEHESALALLEGQVGSGAAAERRLQHNVEMRVLRAPVAGRIGQVVPLRVGSVIAPGTQLGLIVPEGGLKVIAEFPPSSALGRIRPGQEGRVRLAGFPSTEYGYLAATVAQVADEPRGGTIRVELAARPDRRSRLPLQHGLPGTVEVEVERVTPATLVLRAVGKVFDRPVVGGLTPCPPLPSPPLPPGEGGRRGGGVRRTEQATIRTGSLRRDRMDLASNAPPASPLSRSGGVRWERGTGGEVPS